MQIKVFTSGGGILEDKINEFIKDKKVIDIKVNSVERQLGSSGTTQTWYDVMVLYE